MNNQEILLKNNFVQLNKQSRQSTDITNLSNDVVTIINNLSYYGYVPNLELLEQLASLNKDDLISFWNTQEPILKSIKGTDKEMEKFVVYKNFPKEVLEKSDAEYWTAQILMYWGIPSTYFTEPEEKRPALTEQKNLQVLSLANDNTLDNIFKNLLRMPNRWTEEQKNTAIFLHQQVIDKTINISESNFKENIVNLANSLIQSNPETYEKYIKANNATDVLRLSIVMSDGDINLKSPVKFKNFKSKERKFLLNALNDSKNLLEDVSLRPEVFKRLLKNLHPGDYSFENVNNVYDKLYKKEYVTFNSKVQKNIDTNNLEALELLKQRPGEMLRKMHHLYSVYKKDAINTFVEILPKLNVLQLLKIKKYLVNIDERKNLLFAPKGKWSAVQLVENQKVKFDPEDKGFLVQKINENLNNILSTTNQGFDLDEKTKNIKLQTNDQELTSYGRGTSFDIPENTKFIRTASYWSTPNNETVFFDNSWNFFDTNWNPVGICCWNHNRLGDAAIFSGDPINSSNKNNAACQLIDLYLDKLEKMDVKFAVWNILSYSHKPFEEAEVLATLQYGENAEHGNLYEPSRAHMVFPLKGKNLTKYVAMIDVPNKKLVYIDANLYADLSSANKNSQNLSEKMPAYIEYLDSLPSVFDLFENAPKGNIPVLFSDKDYKIETESAYVFKKENPNNNFEDFPINDLLSLQQELPKNTKKITKK